MSNKTLAKKALTISLLAAGLAACSGANNNINSRSTATDPTARTTCSSELNCIRVEFIDDPVVNLNYSCGSVVNVTDETGIASCPANSTVEFYLQSTKTLRRVTFGRFDVKPAGQSILRVTPLDLVANKSDIVRLSDQQATAAVNMTRFLHALRERNNAGVELEPFVDTAPVNRIRITDALKDQLDVLTEDVPAGDFNSEQFVIKLQPFLDATGRTPISAEQAQQRLMLTLRAIKTGVFFGTPTITLPSGDNGNTILDGVLSSGTLTGGASSINDLRLGIEGEAAADAQSGNDGRVRSTLALYALIDRDGAQIGQGLQWAGRANTSEAVFNLFRNNDFDKLRPANSLGGFDPITDRVNGQWQWQSVTTPQKVIDFNDGRLVRNFSMVGSRRLHENLTETTVEPPAGTIGRWVQRQFTDATGASQPQITGTATINRAMSVNSFFDRAVWRTPDTVRVGEQFVFPLHVTLRFRYGGINDGCPQNGCTDLPDLSVTILENGNIISDFAAVESPLGRAGNCSPVNPLTLVDAEGVQEHRVGVVRAVFTGVDPGDAFIGPTMLFSGSVFGEHDGLQIASLAASPRVKMNVAGALGNTPSATINITDSSTAETEVAGQAPARWGNIYNAFTALRVTNDLSPAEQARRAELSKRRQGIVTATVTPCYNTINRTKQAVVPD